MNTPVHVIVLNWNGWQDTIACLDSIKHTDYANLKVIVVDNASTNDSVARIRQAHPDVTIISSEANLGFAGGNNLGIKRAMQEGAEYIWLLNNDTIVEPSSLSAMLQVSQSEDRVGAVGSVLYYMDEPNKVQAWGGGKVYMWAGVARHIYRPIASHRINYITAASILVKRAALEEVGLLDENFFMYWEDVDFSLRLREKGWKLRVAGQSRVYHKEHASLGRHSSTQNKYNQLSNVIFLRKHARFPKLSISIGIIVRIARRILHGDWSRIRDILQAARQANALHF